MNRFTTRSLAMLAVAAGLTSLDSQEASAQPAPTFTRRNVGRAFPDDARGSRIAFGDVDRDGDPDLLVGGKLPLNDGATDDSHRGR